MTTTFVPFTEEKLAALAAQDAARAKAVAHLPKKVNLPGMGGSIPMMNPVAAAVQGAPTQQQRGPTIDPALMRSLQLDQQGNAAPLQRPPVQEPEVERVYLDQVDNPEPGFTRAVADGLYTSVALPSKFAYCDFKDLYVRPFTIKHIAKLQKAHRERSLLPIVEAVSSVIYTTDPRFSDVAMGFQLTLPDFYFVLYWLRLNSFTKSNYIHTTECTDPKHIERVALTEKFPEYEAAVAAGQMTVEALEEIRAQMLPKESLTISQMITAPQMQVNMLDTVPDPTIYRFEDTDALVFRPPTMQDVLEFAEHPKNVNLATRTEFAFLAQLASYVKHRDLPLTLDQRIDIIENATGDQMGLIKDFEKLLKVYGVEEKIQVTCKECGAARVSKLTLAAHSFLPSN